MGEPLKSEFWDFWSEWWLEITDPMTDLMTNQIKLGDQPNHSHEMEYKRDSERTIAMHNAMHPWHGMSHICPFTPIYEGKSLLETISSLQTRTRCSVEIAYNLLGKILLLVLEKILKWRTLYGAVYPGPIDCTCSFILTQHLIQNYASNSSHYIIIKIVWSKKNVS